ncbi:MAG: GNAT family N-acetyltransferase [Variibacter sp.]
MSVDALRDVVVRRASVGDTPEVLLALVQTAFRDLPIDPPSGVFKETVADFSTRLQSQTVFVAQACDDLVGTIFCIARDDALYVGRLAVLPGWRRRGIASALLEAAKAEGRRLGAKRMTLNARIMMPGNVALFQKHGFTIVGEETHAGYSAPTSYRMALTFS